MSRAVAQWDIAKLTDDIAGRGWQPTDLADAAGVARSTVTRFLNGDFQTARTAKKLAEALGYSVRRYLISSKAVA